MKILKMCEDYKHQFIVRTTTSKTCSDKCGMRFHKLKQRDSEIALSEMKGESKLNPKAYVKEEKTRVIQSKQYLILK